MLYGMLTRDFDYGFYDFSFGKQFGQTRHVQVRWITARRFVDDGIPGGLRMQAVFDTDKSDAGINPLSLVAAEHPADIEALRRVGRRLEKAWRQLRQDERGKKNMSPSPVWRHFRSALWTYSRQLPSGFSDDVVCVCAHREEEAAQLAFDRGVRVRLVRENFQVNGHWQSRLSWQWPALGKLQPQAEAT